jgi:hypothetical protein
MQPEWLPELIAFAILPVISGLPGLIIAVAAAHKRHDTVSKREKPGLNQRATAKLNSPWDLFKIPAGNSSSCRVRRMQLTPAHQ